jgi:hypothetical protein
MRSRILIACMLLAACASKRGEPRPVPNEPPAAEAGAPRLEFRTLRGVYYHAWEIQSFRVCGAREVWWVANAADLPPRAESAGLNPDGPLLVEVRASISGRGRFGHLGAYPRQIGIQEVVRVEAARGDSC